MADGDGSILRSPPENAEAHHLKTLAEQNYTSNNLDSAFNFAQRAHDLHPSLDGIPELLAALRILSDAAKPVFSNSTTPDYYKVLDVERFTNIGTIRKQYRKLALTLHPDKSPYSASEEAFKFVAEAMGVLSDRSKRKEYDTKLRVAMQDQVVDLGVGEGEKDVFRGICSNCGAYSEYERKYLGHDLVCGSCGESFKAVEVEEGCENGGTVEVESMPIRVSTRIQERAERYLKIGMLDKLGKGVRSENGGGVDGVSKRAGVKSREDEVVGNGESDNGGVSRKRMKRGRTEKVEGREEETMTLAQMQVLMKKRKVNDDKCLVKERELNKSSEEENKVREKEGEEAGEFSEDIENEKEKTDNMERGIESEGEKGEEDELLIVNMKKNQFRVSKNGSSVVAKRKLRSVVNLDAESPRASKDHLDVVLPEENQEMELERLDDDNSEERKQDEEAGDYAEEIENAKEKTDNMEREMESEEEKGEEDELLIVNMKKNQFRVSKNRSSKLVKRKLRSIVDLDTERPVASKKDDLDVVLVEVDKEMELGRLEENVDERGMGIEMANVMEERDDMEREIEGEEENVEEDQILIVNMKKDRLRVSKNRSSKVAKRKLKKVMDLNTDRLKESEKDDLDVVLAEDREMGSKSLEENEEINVDIEMVNGKKKRDRRISKKGNLENMPVGKEIEKTMAKTREKRERRRPSKYSSLEFLKDPTPESDSDSETERFRLLKKGNLEIMPVEDSDFHDFDRDRRERSFKKGQVWAVYDDHDGMPRHYALVDRVVSVNPFELVLSWVEFQSNGDDELMSREKSECRASCGRFIVTRTVSVKYLNLFSHVVDCERAAREVYRIYPKKGSVWALYADNILNGEETNGRSKDNQRHDVVISLSSYSDVYGLSVGFLEKVDGFKTVFKRKEVGAHAVVLLRRDDMKLFSHQIPAKKLSGDEAPGLPKDCWELDPGSLSPQWLIDA